MAKSTRKKALSLPTVVPPAPATVEIIGTNTPTAQWVTVTPDMAINWLDDLSINVKNRKVREDHVARLASDMLSGKWRGRNGEPIKFDTNGRMFEGQHRCWACVQADKPFETLMITGCDPDDYSTSGIGRPKSFADFLGPVHGEKNVNNLAAACRLVYFWRAGLLPRMKDGKLAPTIQQLGQLLEEEPSLRDSVNTCCSLTLTRRVYPQAYISLIHYAATMDGHNARVMSFMERLGNGLGLTADDPVYQLRRFMLAQKGSKPGQRRVSQLYTLALGIKAWNASKEERPLRVLKFVVEEEWPIL